MPAILPALREIRPATNHRIPLIEEYAGQATTVAPLESSTVMSVIALTVNRSRGGTVFTSYDHLRIRQRATGSKMESIVMKLREERSLRDLRGIGKKMEEDFRLLGIQTVGHLKSCDADVLYSRMCEITRTRQDPCVLDTYRCAIEQARNPNLPAEQCEWWYWSRLRKATSAPARSSGR